MDRGVRLRAGDLGSGVRRLPVMALCTNQRLAEAWSTVPCLDLGDPLVYILVHGGIFTLRDGTDGPDVSAERHLAVTENLSVQALLAEAIDLLFQARGLAAFTSNADGNET